MTHHHHISHIAITYHTSPPHHHHITPHHHHTSHHITITYHTSPSRITITSPSHITHHIHLPSQSHILHAPSSCTNILGGHSSHWKLRPMCKWTTTTPLMLSGSHCLNHSLILKQTPSLPTGALKRRWVWLVLLYALLQCVPLSLMLTQLAGITGCAHSGQCKGRKMGIQSLIFPVQVSMSATAQSDAPEMSIEFTSRDVLNLTLTKTCISLINELACVSGPCIWARVWCCIKVLNWGASDPAGTCTFGNHCQRPLLCH